MSYDEKRNIVYGDSHIVNDDGIGIERRKAANDARSKQTWRSWDTPSQQQRAAHDTAMAQWTRTHPEMAAYTQADKALAGAKTTKWQADAQVSHFETLLSWNLLGKPLKEEVVG